MGVKIRIVDVIVDYTIYRGLSSSTYQKRYKRKEVDKMTVNGINFKNNTNKEVVSILSQKIKTQERIRLWYGDPKTGEAHLGDYNIIGYVNYTTGKVKVPILVYNARSRGGILVRTDEILKITHNKEILYQHPLFHLPKMEIIDNYIFVNGKIYAKFDTREKAQNYISFQKGETNRLM